MLTPDRMRKIDPDLYGLSDAEIKEIGDEMYEIAQIAFDVWWKKKNDSKDPVELFPSEEGGSSL